MRTSSVVISLLLAAGALAQPTFQPLNLVHKRRDWERVNKYRKGNVQYEEYQAVETVTLPAGQRPPATVTARPTSSVTAAAQSAPVVQNKIAVAVENNQGKGQGSGRGNSRHGHNAGQHYTNNKTPQDPAAPVQPAPSQNTNTFQPVGGPATPTATAQQTTAQTPQETGVTASGNCPVGGSAAEWANNPCSGGKSIEASFNAMRSKWIPGLAPMTWKAQLSANARLTAVSPIVTKDGKKQNEGGAMEMNHALNPGSMAQCIASGDGTSTSGGLTPFEKALKMWLCELPQAGNPLGCDNTGNQGDTGHAEIIKSTSYSKFGAYYMDSVGDSGFTGMWTADFA